MDFLAKLANSAWHLAIGESFFFFSSYSAVICCSFSACVKCRSTFSSSSGPSTDNLLLVTFITLLLSNGRISSSISQPFFAVLLPPSPTTFPKRGWELPMSWECVVAVQVIRHEKFPHGKLSPTSLIQS
jgi:hypothetical protein